MKLLSLILHSRKVIAEPLEKMEKARNAEKKKE